IFDEPFSGFDPINANLLRDEILRLRDSGSTIIFSTHNMASVEEMCDNITLINQGHNILTGNVEQIRSDYTRGRYSIDFNGDVRKLAQSLEPVIDSFTLEETTKGRQRMNLLLKPECNLQQAIEIANNTVELASVNEAMASMNEIFINAVNANSTKS
ncbi:MAG: DUF4162 domain-containing protein, partial [Firmicutes bacterium]|nr:DUF4162 domain-containing protein [Bacillota bacterium]